QDPSRKLPKDLLEKMLKARHFLSAMDTLGQVALAALDLAYHTAIPADTTELMRRVFEEFDVRGPSPGTHFQARFGHLMGGYSAGYYGYLWSKVFAQDIFSRFEDEGVLNPKTGADYRRAILEKGSTVDEADQLKAFLGREPDEEAFLRHLGIPPSPLAAAESLANPYAFYRWLSGLPEYSDAGEPAKARALLAAAGLFRKGPVMALREPGSLTLLSVSDPGEPPVIVALPGKDGGPMAAAYSPAEKALARRLEKALARDKTEGTFFNVAGLLSKLGSGTVEADETDEAGRPKPPASVSPASEIPVDPVSQPKEYLARKLRDAMRAADPRQALDILRETRAEARKRLNYQEGSRFLETLRSQAELLAKQFIPGLLEQAQGAAAEGKEALMKARLDAALEFVEYAPGWKEKVFEAYRRAQDTLDLIARYGLPDEKTGLPAAPAVSAPTAREGNTNP
ncbi:MAG: M3 family metallopeptidase, partial [Elusimicrobiota bacterium]